MRARCDGEEPAPAELASDGGRTQTKGVRTLEPMKPGLAEAARPLSAAHQLAAGALPVAPRLPVAWHHASESRAFRSIDPMRDKLSAGPPHFCVGTSWTRRRGSPPHHGSGQRPVTAAPLPAQPASAPRRRTWPSRPPPACAGTFANRDRITATPLRLPLAVRRLRRRSLHAADDASQPAVADWVPVGWAPGLYQ